MVSTSLALDTDALIMNQVTNSLAPRIRAQDLPFDILSYLFPFCLPDNIFQHRQPTMLVAPLVLCHICSSWRFVALFLCPRLWSSLTLVLEYVTVKDKAGSGFQRRKLEALQFWCARMGSLQPSFHFMREFRELERSIQDLVPSHEFFCVPTIQRAERLTLHWFSRLDIKVFNKIMDEFDSSFPYLRTASISQPSGKEYNTICLNVLKAPALKRLYLDCSTVRARDPGKILSFFPWRQLTHLAAKLTVRRSDWEAILDECVSLEYAVFNIRFGSSVPDNTRGRKRRHHTFPSLKHLIVHSYGYLPHADLFNSILFPSLVKLRLSYHYPSYEDVALETLNRMLVTTPAVRELHLTQCIKFDSLGFSDLGGGPVGTTTAIGKNGIFSGSLSRYLPDLELLVIDAIGHEFTCYARPRDLVTFMNSEWVVAGWGGLEGGDEVIMSLPSLSSPPSPSQTSSLPSSAPQHKPTPAAQRRNRTLRFNLHRNFNFNLSDPIIESLHYAHSGEYGHTHSYHSIANDIENSNNINVNHTKSINDYIKTLKGHPWHTEVRYIPDGVWTWKSLTAVDLEEGVEGCGV